MSWSKVLSTILRTGLVFVFLANLGFHPDPGNASSQLYTFEHASCMFKLPEGVEENVDVECGYVSVPEEYKNPNGSRIQLAVAVIRSKDPHPKLDPLFMAQGGPGGSTIDTYASRLLSGSRLRADRDLILFDQRGTMYSKPNLMCKEIDQLTLETIEKDLSDDELERLDLEAMAACRKRLEKEEINLSAFDSLENASDIDAIRQALGYSQINLYGVSYGTLLALHAMSQHPEILRSVILDGVVPPQTNFILDSVHSEDRSFTLLFESCQQDPYCNGDFPDLETVFYDVVRKLNQNPARVPMTDPDSGITYDAVVDGDTFMSGLFQMLYASSLIPALPRMIYDARESKFDFFGRIMSILVFDRTMSYGMYYSVLCAEDADFNTEDQDFSNIHPEIARAEKRSASEFLAICKSWNVQSLDSDVDKPVVSAIPTLILSGNFDPITPPSYGDTVARNLSKSNAYIVPTGGHGQAFEDECQDNIILSFLDDPTKAPDTGCLEKMHHPVFTTSANLIDVPGLVQILNLEGTKGIEMLILLIALLVLGSAVLILPIAWLVNRLRRKSFISSPAQVSLEDSLPSISPAPSPRLFLIRYANWMAILTGFILWVFITGLIVVLVEMVMNNDNRLFFGVTAMMRGWFILPIIAFLLGLGMLVTCLTAWFNHSWSIWMRMYYSLITSAALTSLFILGKWGILTALI